uniref:Replication protein n=1 Tax=uncultured prokaryote TaxID=198431 RepID=A0A0H5Q8D2_9ZZZZ|nr:hypothetical protein [uncultured prokaryote]
MGPPETRSPPPVAAGEGPKSSTYRKRLTHKDTPARREDYARERYWLHGQIRRLLIGDAARIKPGAHAGNVHRVTACTWVRVDDLSLIRPRGRDSYHYKGLATCGSVWTCPLCASKIQERRRQEVLQAITWAASNRHGVAMLSLTFPHRIEQPLSLLLTLQQAALKSLRGSRAYMDLMREVGAAGRIRALEVTHGENGWHPHTHELLFLSPAVDRAWLQSRLASLWLKACRKVGLFQPDRDDELNFLRYSVDVQKGGEGVGSYLAKLDDQRTWGISHELTKSSSKQGRRSGRHPFKLAAMASTSALFVEYVHAMKGGRQLVWSRRLKAAVGVSEKSDEEIAQEEAAQVDDRIALSVDAWRFVLGNDARWELTEAAKSGGVVEVEEFLRLLGYQPGGG